jgi:hypothetical protein
MNIKEIQYEKLNLVSFKMQIIVPIFLLFDDSIVSAAFCFLSLKLVCLMNFAVLCVVAIHIPKSNSVKLVSHSALQSITIWYIWIGE